MCTSCDLRHGDDLAEAYGPDDDRDPRDYFAMPAVCVLCGDEEGCLTVNGDPWCPWCLVDILADCRSTYTDPIVDRALVDSLLQVAMRGLVRRVAGRMEAGL